MKWLKRLWWLTKAVLLTAIVIFLIAYPGEIALEWFGYRFETTVAVFLLFLFVIIITGGLIFSLLKGIITFPKHWAAFQRRRTQQKAKKALVEGFVAIAAGELEEAENLANFAMNVLPEEPLNVMIAAQAAFLQGKAEEAHGLFLKLQQWKETRFLGLRGEALQAMQTGNWLAIQKALRQAAALRPDSPWALKHLFEADLRLGSYERGKAVLEQLQTRGFLEKSEGRRYQALLNWLKAQKEKNAQNLVRFHQFLQKAHDQSPDLVAITVELATYELQNGNPQRAQKILKETWKYQPHPQLIGLLKEASGKKTEALELYRQLEGWSADILGKPETQLLLAEAAFSAQLWGQARQHLKLFHKNHETRRSCQLMAELIRAETPQEELKAKEWGQKAFKASADPCWMCRSCQGNFSEWHVFCHRCGTFDGLTWGFPMLSTTSKGLLPATF